VDRLPETRFATSDGLSIAYQTVGEGTTDVVFVPGFMSHVELNWEFPFMSRLLEPLAEFSRLAVLDKRGTGLSDRSLGLATLEERVGDVLAVMDDAGIARAVLVGVSEGAAMSSLMAASHPERVTALVLAGGLCPGAPSPFDDAAKERLVSFVASRWTTGRVIDMFVQHAPDPEVARARLARFERYCCTPSVAAEIMRRNLESDITTVLPTIAVPTLIVHQQHDPMVPIDHARYYAEHIPGATLRVIEGDFHGSWRAGDYDQNVAIIREFVTGEAGHPNRAPERMLATVLFTDIVDSTARAVELGDDRWRELLDRHDRMAHDEIALHGGVLVKSTGDGVLARFDGPSRAVSCALALEQRARSLGIRLRAGAHTGEVERRGDDVGGLAVHIAARVAATADPDEVLVSRTVTDLTVGSGLTFTDRGEHELKGVPDRWRLYAAAI
jgi:pimeloyl-ACP methyl ester carboxylesterase/class 3 adenylate cyclase